jgi:hypothetical protein
MLGLSAVGEAHDSYALDVTCPICELQFGISVTGNYSAYGNGDEGRTNSYFNVALGSIYYCHRCYYSGRRHAFKSKEDKYFTLDLPNAKQTKAIKAYLKGRKSLLSSEALYPVEYFDIAAHCLTLRQAETDVMLNMHLMCAWMCDDAGEDALAAMYRTRAMAALKQSMSDKTLTPANRFWRRRLKWVIVDNLAKHAEALKGMTELHAEIELLVKTRRKLLPPKPEEFGDGKNSMPYELHNAEERKEWRDGDGKLFVEPTPEIDPETKAKRRKAWLDWRSFTELKNVLSEVNYGRTKLQYKMIGPAKAAALAKKGGYSEKYAFFEVFRSRNASEVASAFETFIANPLGKRPKEYDDDTYEWETREDRAREGLVSCLTRDAGTSPELKELGRRLELKYSRLYARDISYDKKVEADMRSLKKASVASMVKELAEKRKKGKKEDTFLFVEKIVVDTTATYSCYDIVAELARRNNKHATAALLSDFAKNLSWYAANDLEDLRDYLFPETSKDMLELGLSWGYPDETLEYFEPLYRVFARDPGLATAAARRMINVTAKKEGITDTEGVIGIMPLGYLKTEKSRKLLIKAAGKNRPAIAYAAAKCLLIRGDPAGKDAMIKVILKHRMWDLPRDRTCDTFVGMLKPQDLAVLDKLKKRFLDDPEYTKRVKPTIEADGTYEKGLGLPISLVAALTRATPKQQGVYDAFLARLAPPENIPEDKSPWDFFAYRHIDSMMQAARVYYRPKVGKHIALLLDRFGEDDEIGPDLIDALAADGATDQQGTLAALLKRPTPAPLKAALIRASRKLDIPGMPEKLGEWSSSRNEKLAKLAKAEIARKNKGSKKK